MKKVIIMTSILFSIFITGCVNKNIKSISEAYLYLCKISSDNPKNNFQNLKSDLSKFEYKKEDEKKVPMYEPDEEITYSFHEFSDKGKSLNVVLDETNNTLVSSKITSTDSNNTLSFDYITEHKVIEVLKNLKDSYLLKIESKSKDLNSQKEILQYINKYIDDQYLNKYLEISSKLESNEKLSTLDIEKIMNSKYIDTSILKENGETQTCYAYESKSSQLGVFLNEDGLCFKVILKSDTNYNQGKLVDSNSFNNTICYDKNKSLATIQFEIGDKKENLAQINIDLFNSIFE